MTELIYNIFGDATKNVTKTSIVCNNENITKSVGKSALDGPVKPQETTKNTGATKKSFLSNAGTAVQSTPVHQQQLLTAPLPIYSDADTPHEWFEELEFTRPPYKLNNYHNIDIFEDSFELGLESPKCSTALEMKDASMEFQLSYDDDFFTDKIVMDMNLVHEDDLPKIY